MFIIHIGTSGFPTGNNAVIERIRLTFKGLKYAGCDPLIISKHSLYQSENTKRIDKYQGIPYIYTSMLLSRPGNIVVRSLNKISGYLGELVLIVKKRKSIHTAILSGASFGELLYYRVLLKILNINLIIQYVELISSIRSRQKAIYYLNDKLLDNYSFYLCDGIIVISEFLKNRTLSKNKSLPFIKIPAICDFEEFKFVKNVSPGNYLMYCGSIGYFSVIDFIIHLYGKLRELHYYHGKLLLAIGISDKNGEAYSNLIKRINTDKYSDSIVLKENVQHKELINIYLGAELLIVPIRNEPQDIAGFHHKVGEYCAAGKPIISTNLGEVGHYFKDGISAILAEKYTLESYLNKLSEVLPLKEQLNKIAVEGFKVGSEKLNYLSYGAELKQFILKI